jgi:hypothetical protein
MNNTIKTTTTTKVYDRQYKRRDRSVSSETAQKISNSLKNYNATHPRGKASDGSKWSQKISQGQKRAWAQIPLNKDV